MLRSFLRILFSAFIAWSFCAAAVMIPVVAPVWEMFPMSPAEFAEYLQDIMKEICGVLAVLVVILAVLIVPLLHFPRGNPLLHRPWWASLAGAAVFPIASVIWVFGLDALGTLEIEEARGVDWFILGLASALGGAVFAFIHAYLSVLAARK
jgi:quinol-cytochrome oxidoreductase complex cytochrome b subunit